MAIPNYQTLMLPLLKLVAQKGQLKSGEATELISDHFKLTPDERSALLPSGKQEIIANRVGWAKTYMVKAGLLDSPQRGLVLITERGKQVLASDPKEINVQFLSQFPEFQKFRETRHEKDADATPIKQAPSVAEQTPEELFEGAYQELREELIDDLLNKIKSCSPAFFERLVVDVMVAMGYGGSRSEAGKAIGKSGDEGIDGVINEDRLGLDVIYLQAKRWEGNVSRPEIQKFAGAIQGKRAKKGVFITTSDFTGEAKDFVRNIDAKIVLISGRQFAELMLEHRVGVTVTATYELKKIDSDFFEESEGAAVTKDAA
jgi:restriction system protein